MINLDLLLTALLLGLYVALGGGYGLLYAVARLRNGIGLRRAALALYALHAVVAIFVVAWAPLTLGWKALIVASSVGFFVIPPVTWQYLQRIHETEEAQT